MKVFIEFKNDLPLNTDMMAAIEGFEMLGYDIKPFSKLDIATQKYANLYLTNPFIGSTESLNKIFKSLSCLPINLDKLAYTELNEYYKRNIDFDIYLSEVFYIWERTDELYGEVVFVKPIEYKLFDGILIQSPNNLNYLKKFDLMTKVMASDPILKKIKSEYRCFVFNNELVDVRGYSGDFRFCLNKLDFVFLHKLITEFQLLNSPIAYAFDIAILEDEDLILIETSDFYSIGQYGLDPNIYAKMLESRYFEIVNYNY